MLLWGTTSGSKGGPVSEGRPEVKEGFPESREPPLESDCPLTPVPSRVKNHLGGVDAVFILAPVRARAAPG